MVRTRPRLSLDLAWVLLWSGQVEAVEPWLRNAEHALRALDTATRPAAEPTGPKPDAARRALAGERVAIRAELARQRGELDAAIALAQRALDALPADAWRVRGVTTGLLAGAYLSSGDAVAARRAFGAAAAISEAAETITLALFARGRLVQAQVLQGQLQQASETYRQTLGLAARHGVAALPALQRQLPSPVERGR